MILQWRMNISSLTLMVEVCLLHYRHHLKSITALKLKLNWYNPCTPDGHNIASVSNVQYLQSQLNNFEQELNQQNEMMKQLDSRLQKVESQSISNIPEQKINPKPSETQTPTKSESKTITNAPKAANQMNEEKEESPSIEPQSTAKPDSGYTTPTDAILENPLNDPKCANALIEHENIDIESLIKEHHHQIPCTKRQETIPSIWTREAIGALTHHECYRPHTPLRTTNQQWDMINNQTAESAKEQGIDAPVYCKWTFIQFVDSLRSFD